MGRPSLYNPAHCEAIIEHCRDGASITSFAAEIGVCRDTISEWAAKHEDFSVAVKRAKAVCAAWWEKTARDNAAGAGNGNATLCIFGLKNMAPEDWKDKQEHEHSGRLVVEGLKRTIYDPRHPDGEDIHPAA